MSVNPESPEAQVSWRILATTGAPLDDLKRFDGYARRTLTDTARVARELEATYNRNRNAILAQKEAVLARVPAALRATYPVERPPSRPPPGLQFKLDEGLFAEKCLSISDPAALYKLLRSYMPSAATNSVTQEVDKQAAASASLPNPPVLASIGPKTYNSIALTLLAGTVAVTVYIVLSMRRDRKYGR